MKRVFIDHGNVTVLQFANNNDLNVQALRSMVRHDRGINSTFVKNGTNYYDLKELNEWLVINSHKFEAGYVRNKSPAPDNEFWCGNCGRYKSKEEKVEASAHCSSCVDKTKSPTFINNNALPARVIHTDSRRRIDAILERRTLERNLDIAWGLEYE